MAEQQRSSKLSRATSRVLSATAITHSTVGFILSGRECHDCDWSLIYYQYSMKIYSMYRGKPVKGHNLSQSHQHQDLTIQKDTTLCEHVAIHERA